MSKKIVAPAYVAAMERAEADPAAARFWVGLDIGFKSTAVCVVDVDGAVVHQVSMKSHATEIGRYLRRDFKSHVTLIGLETGGLSPHLAGKLRGQGFQVVVLDALQVHRVPSVKRNKTDTNDARGIAEIMRTGRDYLTEVYVKSNLCFEVRAYLVMRDRLVKQRRETEAMIRGLVRVYGGLIERELELLAASNPVCKRFMEIPGIGTITALSFYSAIEDPTRFRHVDDVAAYLGLTLRVYQSGESLTHGGISKMGNQLTRTHLVGAATVMLAIVMFSLWRDGTHFMAKAADVGPHRDLMQARATAATA